MEGEFPQPGRDEQTEGKNDSNQSSAENPTYKQKVKTPGKTYLSRLPKVRSVLKGGVAAVTAIGSMLIPSDSGNISQEAAQAAAHLPPGISQPGEFLKPPQQFQYVAQESASVNDSQSNKDNVQESIPLEEKDMQTRFMEAAEKERKQKIEALRINETAQEINRNTVIIDYAFSMENPRLQMMAPQASQELLFKNILKDDYVSAEQLEQEFGENFREKMDDVWKKYPKVALAYYWLNEYGNHGIPVERSTSTALEAFGFSSEQSDFYPLQNLSAKADTNISDYEIKQDELGNTGIFSEIKPELLIDVIKKINNVHPEKTRFNFSFTLGKGGFWVITKEMVTPTEDIPNFLGLFDEKRDETVYFPETAIGSITNKGVRVVSQTGEPINPLNKEEMEKEKKKATQALIKETTYDSPRFSKVDGYNPANASESLSKIFKVVDAFPDSIFFAAAGNNIDDLREMKDQQPNNLVFVAQWNSYKDGPDGRVDGADIYFDNYFFGLGAGSSFSTPAISALADILETYGLDNRQIVSTLRSSCDLVSYERDGQVFDADLFNPEKFKVILETLKTEQELKKVH
ncbi:hypothetical protein C4577_04400 [Candidatus Parcubacteria bacterium]|nr:MAG: hypothetical protein C4577_04400 [Candidatus Parcubacteria bacterium]